MNSNNSTTRRIFSAATEGQSNLLQVLLKDDTSNDLHMAAFEEAIEHGHVNAVDVFLEHNKEYSQSNCALERCLSNKHLHIFDRLVDIASNQARNRAISIAAYHGMEEVVEKLLTYPIDKINLDVALQYAAGDGQLDMVKRLSPRVSREKHTVALEWAIYHHHVPTALFLIPLCDPKLNKSKALQYAVEQKLFDLADILYPLSEPDIALQAMREDLEVEPGDSVSYYLEERLEGERIKRVLNGQINQSSSLKVRKM